MIIEAHWRRIKHGYLHRFNRSRIDLVIWILVTKIIPDSVYRLDVLTSGISRLGIASWRKAFKKEWKILAAKEIEDLNEKLSTYHTDPASFVCACPGFLLSRFLIWTVLSQFQIQWHLNMMFDALGQHHSGRAHS